MSGRKLSLLIAINLAALAALLGAIELGARWIQARRLGPGAYEPAVYMDRWTAWRNAPGYQRAGLRHNAQGFRRDKDVALEKPANTFRIFLLGGSTAYGYEGLYKDEDPDWKRIANPETIDAYLEAKLRQRRPERNWEVINAASIGFSLHQSLMLIHAKILAYRPDMVILLDGHNDIFAAASSLSPVYDPFAETPHADEFHRMVYPKSLGSWLFVNSAWLRNNSVAYSVLKLKLQGLASRGATAAARDAGQDAPARVRLEDLTPELRERARAGIAKLAIFTRMAGRIHAALAAEGVAAVFALQPELILSEKPLTPAESRFAGRYRRESGRYTLYMYEQGRPEIATQMAESARSRGFRFEDLGGVFQGAPAKTFTDFCHLTAKGNELVAERLYRIVAPE